MRLYSNKQKWKIILLIVALILIGVSLLFSNSIVSKVSQRERDRVTQWADAIKKRAELVRLTNRSFSQLREKELAEMELWIAATKEVSKASPLNSQQSFDLPLKIINTNKDIPVIVLDQDKRVSTHINLGFDKESLQASFPKKEADEIKKLFEDSLIQLASNWEQINPSFTIEIYEGLFMTYYYNDSRTITRLEKERDSLINAFNKELIENTDLVPVVLTDSAKSIAIVSNLDSGAIGPDQLPTTLKSLSYDNKPIPISFEEGKQSWVFYANSPELTQLQYFPYIQFLLIGLFILIGYIIFSTFRKAEQNKVWAGMAKETAHQLGTPLSSLMAWIELLKEMDIDKSIPVEMDKDIKRLSQVTERFSKIGANTSLKDEDIVTTTHNLLSYLKTRIPKKILIHFDPQEKNLTVPHNSALFEWVLENICKNAIDAMQGEGNLWISIHQTGKKIHIDIKDDGKGMTTSQQRSVFQPGFTTKKRGWGLGLSLAKRIIEQYHKGKIGVLHSEPSKGTAFRITLLQK